MKKITITIAPEATIDPEEILRSVSLPKGLITRPQMIEKIRAYWEEWYGIMADTSWADEDTAAFASDHSEKVILAACTIGYAIFDFRLDYDSNGHFWAKDATPHCSNKDIADIMDVWTLAERFSEIEQAIVPWAVPNPTQDLMAHWYEFDIAGDPLDLQTACNMMSNIFYKMAGTPEEERRKIRDGYWQKYISRTA